MTTPPTPSHAKTREEWETRIKEISEANSKARDTLKHLCHEKWDGRDGWHWEIPANPEKDTDLIIGKSLNHVSGLCDAIMSLQAEAKQLDGDKWLLNRKIEIALDEYGKLKASATKLQAENQELRAEVERLRDIVAEVHSMAVQAGIRGEFIPTDFIRSAIEKARQPNVRLHP